MDDKVISDVWDSTSKFFDLPVEEKMNYTKPQHIYPFGYSPLGAEALSKGKMTEFDGSDKPKFAPPDLKGDLIDEVTNPDTYFSYGKSFSVLGRMIQQQCSLREYSLKIRRTSSRRGPYTTTLSISWPIRS